MQTDRDFVTISPGNIRVHYKSLLNGKRLKVGEAQTKETEEGKEEKEEEEEEHTVIVLMHAFVSSLGSFCNIDTKLSFQYPQMQVVSFDRLTFGLTERPLNWTEEQKHYLTLQGQIEFCFKVIERLAIHKHSKFILMGNSAGGSLAFHMYLKQPDRIAGIFGLAPAAMEKGPPQIAKMLTGSPIISNLTVFTLGFISGPFSLAYHNPRKVLKNKELSESYSKVKNQPGWGRSMVWFTILGGMSEGLQDAIKAGSFNQAKIAIISGVYDKVVKHATSKLLLNCLVDAGNKFVTFEEIQNCGHLPQEESPEEVLTLFKSYIERLQAKKE